MLRDCMLTPFQLAVIVTGVVVVTACVGIITIAEGLPDGIVTSAGGLAAEESLVNRTTAPFGGA